MYIFLHISLSHNTGVRSPYGPKEESMLHIIVFASLMAASLILINALTDLAVAIHRLAGKIAVYK